MSGNYSAASSMELLIRSMTKASRSDNPSSKINRRRSKNRLKLARKRLLTFSLDAWTLSRTIEQFLRSFLSTNGIARTEIARSIGY